LGGGKKQGIRETTQLSGRKKKKETSVPLTASHEEIRGENFASPGSSKKKRIKDSSVGRRNILSSSDSSKEKN